MSEVIAPGPLMFRRRDKEVARTRNANATGGAGVQRRTRDLAISGSALL